MPPHPPQLRLVRTGGTVQAHPSVMMEQCFCAACVFTFITWDLQQPLKKALHSSVLQDFGRGRSLISRCDFTPNLIKRGCAARFIENPTSSISVLQAMPLSSKGSASSQYNVVQIMPQKLSLSLRPGQCSAQAEAHLKGAGQQPTASLSPLCPNRRPDVV